MLTNLNVTVAHRQFSDFLGGGALIKKNVEMVLKQTKIFLLRSHSAGQWISFVPVSPV